MLDIGARAGAYGIGAGGGVIGAATGGSIGTVGGGGAWAGSGGIAAAMVAYASRMARRRSMFAFTVAMDRSS